MLCVAISIESSGLRTGIVEPVRQSVTVTAPATVANLGPGFDWLGCAVQVRYGYAAALPPPSLLKFPVCWS